MAKKDVDKWTMLTACACVIRNGGKADSYKKHVSHPMPGLKVLGAMDYLINKHKFIKTAGDEKPKSKIPKEVVAKEQKEVIVTYKTKRKEKK